jgi:hypothetical protein
MAFSDRNFAEVVTGVLKNLRLWDFYEPSRTAMVSMYVFSMTAVPSVARL